MRKKILASLLCLVFLFSIVGMAMAAPQDGFYVNGHRYSLDLNRSDPGYQNYLSDMQFIGFDFTRLLIVLNNRFALARNAVDEGSIDPVLQDNAHQQVGGTIPGTIQPIGNDGTTGPAEPVSSTDKIVTGVAIKTAPTKTTYTAGEKLDLTGLVVTLTNSDATTDDVALANFSTNGISTSPANGATLATTNTEVVITVNGKTANQAITVNAPAVVVTGVAVKTAPAKTTYTEGETLDLTGLVVTLTKSDASTEDVALANFAAKGIATSPLNGAVLAITDTQVIITVNEKTASQTITVNSAAVAVTGVSLNEATLNLTAGGATATLVATVAPANATNQNVTWSSSDNDVATVANGVVTSVGAGTATITVTTEDGNFTATCSVTVATGEELAINPESYDLNKNAPVNDILIDITWGPATKVDDVVLHVVSPSGPIDLSLNYLEEAGNGKFYYVEGNVLTIKKELIGLFEEFGYPLETIPDGFPINLSIIFDAGEKAFLITIVDGEAPTVAVTGVSLNTNTLTLTEGGDTATLVATVTPADATNKNVTWSSSNDAVATVANGVVTPVGAGTATITVTTEDGNFIATCSVTVATGEELAINPESYGLNKNAPVNDILIDITWGPATKVDDIVLHVVSPSGPIDLSLNYLEEAGNGKFYYVEGNVLTIKKELIGLFEEFGYPLETIPDGFPINLSIIFDAGEKAFLITIVDGEAPTVAVTGVSLDEATLNLTAGGATATLVATVTPANATNKNVTWSSSNDAVATVADGVVTPVAVGTATITVTTEDGNFTAACEVAVEAATVAVTGVSLNTNTLTLTEGGDTATLVATVTPADATNQNVTWSSSNDAVATVANGVVTPVGAGTATITVTTEDGNFTATCAVTVEAVVVATPQSLISNAIAHFTPIVSSTLNFKGQVLDVKVVGTTNINKLALEPAPGGRIDASKVAKSNLDIDIDNVGKYKVTDFAVFPMYELFAGPEATGVNLVSSGTLTEDASTYTITLTNVDCPKSILDIMLKAANMNSSIAMVFEWEDKGTVYKQKLSCKITISKATGLITKIDNFSIVGKTKITKSTFNLANGTYDNNFYSESPLVVTYQQ